MTSKQWWMGAAAAVVLSTALVACKKEEQKVEQPPATPASPATYTLTPESNAQFLKDNASKPGVTVLPDGLQYRVLKAGAGKSPTSGDDVVTVTYKGWTIDGKVFDQTPPGQTAQFPAGRLIQGWVEALSLMKEGDSWQIVLPSDLAYGPSGAPPDIGPNQTLVFDMELIGVTPATPTP